MPTPLSPFTQTVYPPIEDLNKYRRDLRDRRAHFDVGRDIEEIYSVGELLDTSEALLDQCDFLNKKLVIKVPIHFTDDILTITVDIADEASLPFM